jgi:hypothetical protein
MGRKLSVHNEPTIMTDDMKKRAQNQTASEWKDIMFLNSTRCQTLKEKEKACEEKARESTSLTNTHTLNTTLQAESVVLVKPNNFNKNVNVKTRKCT